MINNVILKKECTVTKADALAAKPLTKQKGCEDKTKGNCFENKGEDFNLLLTIALPNINAYFFQSLKPILQ